jgi:hypothetical protein
MKRDPAGSALRLTEHRLQRALWPIFEGTRNRAALLPGAKAVFYVGGTREGSGSLVATATVARKLLWSPARGSIDPPQLVFEHPAQALALVDIVRVEPPIRFLDVLGRLSFCPANMGKWGAVLMGGCRALSPADWATLQDALSAPSRSADDGAQ